MANLILWRHAEAEDRSDSGLDADRELTKTGLKDAAKIAQWLHKHLPDNTEIFCSPALRCQQTVAALTSLYPQGESVAYVADFLSVDSSVERMLIRLKDDGKAKTLLWVGHQPNLGLLIANLLNMRNSACVVKKSAVWWLRERNVEGELQTYLFTVQHPDY